MLCFIIVLFAFYNLFSSFEYWIIIERKKLKITTHSSIIDESKYEMSYFDSIIRTKDVRLTIWEDSINFVKKFPIGYEYLHSFSKIDYILIVYGTWLF